jgi:tubulin epsilon
VVQIGQCGNQVGHQFWKMGLKEQALSPSDTFFYETKSSTESTKTLKARAVLIDMEESVISRISNEKTNGSSIYDSECKILDQSGAGNNWAVGHFEYMNQHKTRISEVIRHQAEKCDCLQGIFTIHSMGGGTGSGLGSAVTEFIGENYSEVERFSFPVYPNANQDDVITSPYNCVLATASLQRSANVITPFDNHGLEQKIIREDKAKSRDSRTSLASQKPPSKQSAFDKINNQIAKCMIDLTAHSRYKGPLNVDLNEISTNMIPFLNLNYLTINTTLINKQHLRTAFHETFTKSLTSTIDPTTGVFITAAALLRSKTHDLHQLRDAISHTKKSMKFPLWNLDGWKIGVTRNTGFSKYDSVMSLTNNTQVSNFLDLNLNRFGNIFKRKAHLHHYTRVDGCELSTFTEAVEQLRTTSSCYKDIQATWQDSPKIDGMLPVV